MPYAPQRAHDQASRQGGSFDEQTREGIAAPQGLWVAEEATREAELRTSVQAALETHNYDTLTVAQITEKLGDLSANELKRLRELEKRTKDRESLVERIDRKIRANS